MTAISPPPVTQPLGYGLRVTTPVAALGNVPAGGTCVSLSCGGPSENLAVLIWRWGVWHREQVGPALPACFSFTFIINLGHNPEHRRVQNDQLFGRLGVSLCLSFVLGFLFKSSPCKRSSLDAAFLLLDLLVLHPRAGILGLFVHANILFKGPLPGFSSGPTLSTDF